jgi:3-hydroxybutyryl-CoA dehydrogenase
MTQISTIGIIGAGTMGQGIAQICAQAGYSTWIFDTRKGAAASALSGIEASLEKGVDLGKLTNLQKSEALGRLSIVEEVVQCRADLIIEAIIENLDIKKQLFADLEQINGPETILASNTSSLPITRMAAGLQRPERVVGLHFFNPAHIMKLVEVISGAATLPTIAEAMHELALRLGKVPVHAQDAPGFIVNRVARHYYVESLKALEEGLASHEQIDALLEATGFKMGPFRLMDLIGVDTNFSVTSSMYQAFHFDGKFRPSRIQQQKVDAGHHGRKSGKGFYSYD